VSAEMIDSQESNRISIEYDGRLTAEIEPNLPFCG